MNKKISMLVMTVLMLLLSFEASAWGIFGKKSDSDKFTLKMGMTAGVQSNEYKAASLLADYVEKESDGKLKIKLYPDSQLGDDRECLEQLSAGQLDLTFAETGRMGLWNKKAVIFQLPYIFENYNHLQKALETDAAGELVEEFVNDFNWRILGNAYNGTRQTSSNKPINTIEDMKGMKLRVPNAKANLDYAKYSGASATPMAFTEVYLALQTNAVDGQENPLSTIKTTKFYEVQDYIALTNHILNDANYIVSEITWKKLPEDLQKILKDGVKKAADLHTSLFQKDEKDLLEFFETNGLKITKPSTKEFREKMQPVYDEYLKENGKAGKKLLDAINSVK